MAKANRCLPRDKRAAKTKPYCVRHANSTVSEVEAGQWILHVNRGNLIHVEGRKARVAAHLACYVDPGTNQLVFVPRPQPDPSPGVGSIWPAIEEMLVRLRGYPADEVGIQPLAA